MKIANFCTIKTTNGVLKVYNQDSYVSKIFFIHYKYILAHYQGLTTFKTP